MSNPNKKTTNTSVVARPAGGFEPPTMRPSFSACLGGALGVLGGEGLGRTALCAPVHPRVRARACSTYVCVVCVACVRRVCGVVCVVCAACGVCVVCVCVVCVVCVWWCACSVMCVCAWCVPGRGRRVCHIPGLEPWVWPQTGRVGRRGVGWSGWGCHHEPRPWSKPE